MSESAPKPTGTRWSAPAIDGSDGRGFLTASRLQALQREVCEEARTEGYAQGLEDGRAEMERRRQRFDALLSALQSPFDELEEVLERQLVDLAIAIARQLFRREIQIDPGHVIGVVRETVPLLPAASRDIKVHLHPDDAQLVRDAYVDGGDDPAWHIVEDPLIDRGGCRVSSDNSHIDATADTRFRAIVDAITGDERQR